MLSATRLKTSVCACQGKQERDLLRGTERAWPLEICSVVCVGKYVNVCLRLFLCFVIVFVAILFMFTILLLRFVDTLPLLFFKSFVFRLHILVYCLC